MARYPGFLDTDNYGARNPELGVMHNCITHGHPLPDKPPANFLFLAVRLLCRYEGYEEQVDAFSKKLAAIIIEEGTYRSKLGVYDLHLYRYYSTGLCVMKEANSWNNSTRAVILDSFEVPESAKPKSKKPANTKINEYKGITDLAKTASPTEYLQFRQYLKEVREKNVTIVSAAGYVKELRNVATYFERYDNFIKMEETMKEMPERHMVMAEKFGMLRVPDYRFTIYVQDRIPRNARVNDWYHCGDYINAVAAKGFKIIIESNKQILLSLLVTPNELTEVMEAEYNIIAGTMDAPGGELIDLTHTKPNCIYDVLRHSRKYYRGGLYTSYEDTIYIPILTDEMYDYYEAMSRSNATDRYKLKRELHTSANNTDEDIDEATTILPSMFSEKQWGRVSDIGISEERKTSGDTIRNANEQLLYSFLSRVFGISGISNNKQYRYHSIPDPAGFKHSILPGYQIVNNEQLEPLRTLLMIAEVSTLRESIGVTESDGSLIYDRRAFVDVEKEIVLLKEAITKIAHSRYGSLVIKAGKLERYVIPEEEE